MDARKKTTKVARAAANPYNEPLPSLQAEGLGFYTLPCKNFVPHTGFSEKISNLEPVASELKARRSAD